MTTANLIFTVGRDLRIVVDRAPETAHVSRAVIGMLLSEDRWGVEVKGDRLTFGVEGEGEGRVTYMLTAKWAEFPPGLTVIMRRVPTT